MEVVFRKDNFNGVLHNEINTFRKIKDKPIQLDKNFIITHIPW